MLPSKSRTSNLLQIRDWKKPTHSQMGIKTEPSTASKQRQYQKNNTQKAAKLLS
jgi:hypothetical protein